jgi:hypothetical protein
LIQNKQIRMATKPNTRVRFLGGNVARPDLLGFLACPVVIDGTNEEHTRFFMVTPEKWFYKAIDADLVSATYVLETPARGWLLLGKRGDIYGVRSSGITQEQIPDAGTGPGKYGYLTSIKNINGRLLACGDCRQVYERTEDGWVHRDQGILLPADTMDQCLNDIAGNAQGHLCSVGDEGEIAIDTGHGWAMQDSPTNEHLYAVCTDDQGRFCAAGANGTVLRGTAEGFEVLCAGGDFDSALWDIKFHQGEIVVSATPGVFVVRDGALVPFDKPAAPTHVGYKLVTAGDILWSVGTHQIFCLDNGTWTEWICPDNAP